jgi:hypothetical protein
VAAGFAALLVTAPFPFVFLVTGFWAGTFLAATVFAPVSRALDCFAATFLAVAVTATPDFRAVPVVAADLRERDGVAFWLTVLGVARFAPDPPFRADAGFALRSWAVFGRDTLTSPRMAFPDGRPLAAAFAVTRRFDLLCEVEAMGTTLVTVATW